MASDETIVDMASCNGFFIILYDSGAISITHDKLPDSPALYLEGTRFVKIAAALHPNRSLAILLAAITDGGDIHQYTVGRNCITTSSLPPCSYGSLPETPPYRTLAYCTFTVDSRRLLVCADHFIHVFETILTDTSEDCEKEISQTLILQKDSNAASLVSYTFSITATTFLALHEDGEVSLWSLEEERLLAVNRDCINKRLCLGAACNNKVVVIDDLGDLFVFNYYQSSGTATPLVLIARTELRRYCYTTEPAPETQTDAPRRVTGDFTWQAVKDLPEQPTLPLSLLPLRMAVCHVPQTRPDSFDTHVALIATETHLIGFDVYSLLPVLVEEIEMSAAMLFDSLTLTTVDFSGSVVRRDLTSSLAVPDEGHALSRSSEGYPVDSVLSLIRPVTTGAKTGKKRPGTAVKNKPVTFGKNIRSSGYTKDKPVMTMFGKKPKTAKKTPPRPEEYPIGPISFEAGFRSASHVHPVRSVRFSADGQTLAVGSQGAIDLHRLDTRGRVMSSSSITHAKPVNSLGWLGSSFVAVAQDTAVTVYHAKGALKSLVAFLPAGERGRQPVQAVLFPKPDVVGPEPTPVVCSSAGASLFITKLKLVLKTDDLDRRPSSTAAKLGEIRLDGTISAMAMPNFAYSHHIVAACGKTLSVVDLSGKEGAVSIRIPDAHDRPIDCVEVPNSRTHPHPDTILTSSRDGLVKLWDTRAPACVAALSIGVGSTSPCGAPAQFSPCGRYVVSGSDSGVDIHDIRFAASVDRLVVARGGHVSAVDWSPLSPLFVAGTSGASADNEGVYSFVSQ
ncbi:WD domain, G-beta repeat [Carpediemonas membranifera]|uniref:WD domain, G-beta repeat n=1 Tax=Carpediemonas membranifera TaxID=201153 RepID=A0A8J6B5J3_9EUKA|nr:WD domain, G-beta repeat [Carpediemonas membranifera]|eukprot:KAG9394729.1 WD domain, G-beta repeat [Carpediemonas membranifera]